MRCGEDERVSLLVGDIYDAALKSSQWVDVLGKIRAFVVGHAASLYWKDVASKSGAVHYDDGVIEPQYRQSYFDQYIKLDPTSTGLFFAKAEEPTATADFVSHDEFVRRASTRNGRSRRALWIVSTLSWKNR